MAGFGLARYLIAGTAFVRVHASVIRAKFTPLCSSTLSARLTDSGCCWMTRRSVAAGPVDRETYLRDMEWKRSVHAAHGTVLTETFSHERAEGRLIARLREKLAAQGVAFSSVSPEDVFAVLEEPGRVDPFTRLVATFLQHFKGARLAFDQVSRRTASLPERARAVAFLDVFRPIAVEPSPSASTCRPAQPLPSARGLRAGAPVPESIPS